MGQQFEPIDRPDERGLARREGFWPAAMYAPFQLLSEFFPKDRRSGPTVEIAEEGGDVVVRAELPGMKPDDVGVWIDEDRVTLRGERRREHTETEQGYFHTERQYGSFQRTIPLPAAVDATKAKAQFEHGMLELRAPKINPQNDHFGHRVPLH